MRFVFQTSGSLFVCLFMFHVWMSDSWLKDLFTLPILLEHQWNIGGTKLQLCRKSGTIKRYTNNQIFKHIYIYTVYTL